MRDNNCSNDDDGNADDNEGYDVDNDDVVVNTTLRRRLIVRFGSPFPTDSMKLKFSLIKRRKTLRTCDTFLSV